MAEQLKKIELARLFLKQNQHLFSCPHCNARFEVPDSYSFKCHNGHHFDLSRRGSLYFLKGPAPQSYKTELWQARQRITRAGFFNPLQSVLQEYADTLSAVQAIVDAGCGEGTLLAGLSGSAQRIGFDISRSGVDLATAQSPGPFWCIADLSRPPFSASAVDLLFNILSPANYSAFRHILKPGAGLVKVIPGPEYLIELRQLLYSDQPEKRTYDNQSTLSLFDKHFPSFKRRRLHYPFKLDAESFDQLLQMTPLSWGALNSSPVLKNVQPLPSVTIDLEILSATI